ncbi:unnamed protein product [Cochlearia groenlandica]
MSGSGSSASNGKLAMEDMICFCGKSARVLQAWTDDNPGRRFYRCADSKSRCNFFQWLDVEKPHGWQKKAFVETREEIKEQKTIILQLKEEMKMFKSVHQSEDEIEVESKNRKSILLYEVEIENKMLKQEITGNGDKEKMLRQFVMISWLGFVIVIVVVVHALK